MVQAGGDDAARSLVSAAWLIRALRSHPANHREPISSETIDRWHFQKLLFGLTIYEITAVTLKNGQPVEIVGDYEDSRIQLVYSQTCPGEVSEIHFSNNPSATGTVIRCPEEMAAVRMALRPLLKRFFESLADEV